jgi:hypothetical protein
LEGFDHWESLAGQNYFARQRWYGRYGVNYGFFYKQTLIPMTYKAICEMQAERGLRAVWEDINPERNFDLGGLWDVTDVEDPDPCGPPRHG